MNAQRDLAVAAEELTRKGSEIDLRGRLQEADVRGRLRDGEQALAVRETAVAAL